MDAPRSQNATPDEQMPDDEARPVYPARRSNHHWILDEEVTGRDVVASENTSVPPAIQPAQLERVAETTAREAADLVRRMRGSLADAAGVVAARETKSSAVDPVTDVDRASEELIRRRLVEQVPGTRVLGEEMGDGDDAAEDAAGPEGSAMMADSTNAAQDVLWVVDPIDGTVNFMYGVPAYAVSIAATLGGVPVAAAVADVAHGDVYVAHVGGPARKLAADGSEQELRGGSGEGAGSETGLDTALVATGFSYLAPRRREQAELLTHLLGEVRDIRRIGSAALDLCHVASGVVDAYYEHGLGPWDHAAGALIAARAGAVVEMPHLGISSEAGVQVVAAKASVYPELADLLKRHVTGGVLHPISRHAGTTK